jgi:hypothetical protein
MNMGLA